MLYRQYLQMIGVGFGFFVVYVYKGGYIYMYGIGFLLVINFVLYDVFR